jgi:similar to stage IV sporulation protein
MIGIDFFLFGYRLITLDAAEKSTVSRRLFDASIPMRGLKNGCIAIAKKHEKKVLALCPFLASKMSKLKGLPEIICRNRKRYGVFAALLVCLPLFLFSMGRVWDIRILGASEKTASEVRAALESEGVREGARFRALDFSETENRLKNTCPSVAWVNAHRRGTVLYVRLVEHEEGRAPNASELCNIVASEDCVITSVAPSSGVAMVKPGDAVKKGDLLISAVHADGTVSGAAGEVKGLVSGRASVFCGREEMRSVSEKVGTASVEIRFLNFSFFIFKNYGNLQKEYVIIKGEKQLRLFRRFSLPFFITVNEAYTVREQTVGYSDGEIVTLAGIRMREALSSLLSEGSLESMRTVGEWKAEGYALYTEYVQERKVCESVPIRLVGDG